MSDERPRYAHYFRCRTCGGRFNVVRLTADPAKVKAPKCPKRGCLGKIKESHTADIGFDPAEGKAPALGGSSFARAMDITQNIVAQDHGMTDLSDTMRPGEVTAPRLRPDLQKQADEYFSPPKRQRRGKIDMSPLYGDRAAGGQNGQMPAGVKFEGGAHPIAPILQSRPTGSSPIPHYTDVATPKN